MNETRTCCVLCINTILNIIFFSKTLPHVVTSPPPPSWKKSESAPSSYHIYLPFLSLSNALSSVDSVSVCLSVCNPSPTLQKRMIIAVAMQSITTFHSNNYAKCMTVVQCQRWPTLVVRPIHIRNVVKNGEGDFFIFQKSWILCLSRILMIFYSWFNNETIVSFPFWLGDCEDRYLLLVKRS